jgi:hemerythrin-like domain-containing protein
MEQGKLRRIGWKRRERFFQKFADQCHHGKEEDVFFPVLKQFR